MRIDSAGSSVTFITLDSKIRAAHAAISAFVIERVLESYLTQSRTHANAEQRLNVYTPRYDQPRVPDLIPYRPSMHNVRNGKA